MAYTATDGTRTFSGHYRWDGQDLSGNLEAVFTPTGEATWDVSFSFKFQGPHAFSGTAEGSLKRGKLEGTVRNERETRSYDFRGTVKKGKRALEQERFRSILACLSSATVPSRPIQDAQVSVVSHAGREYHI